MSVFKGYLKIIWKNIGIVISYMGFFYAISIMIIMNIPSQQKKTFNMEKMNISVIDEDQSVLSEALTDYLAKTNTVTRTTMNREELARKIYSRNTEYVLRIPEGFGGHITDGSIKLAVTKVPDSSSGYYLDSCIEQFSRTASAFVSSGYTDEEAARLTLSAAGAEPDVQMIDTGKRTDDNWPNYAYTFQYFPYLYISLMIYSISYVLIAFSSREIRMRTLSSPVSPVSQTFQAISAFVLLFLVFWVLSLLMPAATKGIDFYTSPLAGYYILNSLALLVSSISIGFLIGNLVRSQEAVAAAANIIALGMSFLCGVFVPMDLLGSGVRSMARFLPVYWYEIANGLLAENTTITGQNRSTILTAIAIQAAFALAIITVTLFIIHKKHQEA